MSPQKTTTTRQKSLPTLTENPESDVVIFDGECVFCRRQVERLHRWDGRNRLAFVSLHDPVVAEKWPHLSHAELMEQMYVVTPQGDTWGGAAAFRYLTRRLPRLWWLAPLMHVPFSLPLWQALYRWVAARRYRIAGKDCAGDQCKIHFDR